MSRIVGFLVIVLLGGSLACAQDVSGATSQGQIAPQAVADALTVLARQSGLQIIYGADVVRGRRSNGAPAGLSAKEALARVLEGTGLSFEFLNERTVTITQAGGKPAVRKESPEAAGLRVAETESAADAAAAGNAQGEGERQTSSRDEEGSKAGKLEEIVVTAQKRDERLIDVPLSISVLSADTLATLGATQFRDFANSVPGLSFNTFGTGFTQVTLRGVTSGFYDISPTVGIYVDEVPYGSSTGFAGGTHAALDVALFDMDRIEVLRGPQGTLYGASTMGGLLKYVSKRPDAAGFAGDAQAGVSSTRRGGVGYNAGGAINIPIMPGRAALRVSGFESHDGGYIDNVALGEKDVDRSDVYGGRVDLLLTPADSLSVRLNFFLQNISRDGEATADYDFVGEPLYGEMDQYRLFDEPTDHRYRQVSGTVNYRSGIL